MQSVLEDSERSNIELKEQIKEKFANEGVASEEKAKTSALLEKLQIENDGVERLREQEEHLSRELEQLKLSLAETVEEHNIAVAEVDEEQRINDAAMRKYRSQKQKLKRAKAASAAAIAAYRSAIGFSPTDKNNLTEAEKRVQIMQLSEGIRKATEVIANAASHDILIKLKRQGVLDDFDGAAQPPLSPTSSLSSFFTLASSDTESVRSSLSSVLESSLVSSFKPVES